MPPDPWQIRELLDKRIDSCHPHSFIKKDPVQIPRLFTKQQDAEIAGLFAALFAWGRRDIIIKKCHDLLERMDYSPFEFIKYSNTETSELLEGFKHRTFKSIDIISLVQSLKLFYSDHISLEEAFQPYEKIIEGVLNFRKILITAGDNPRLEKHISNPEKGSAAKRVFLYLKWMVRKDKIDPGGWSEISPAHLIIPLDIHVHREALKLGITQRKQRDINTAVEITEFLRKLDPEDPLKYDLALFQNP